jgi:hypothetical protein
MFAEVRNWNLILGDEFYSSNVIELLLATALMEIFFYYFIILIPNYICNLFKNIQQKVWGEGRGWWKLNT